LSDGLLGCRESGVLAHKKYRQAQGIIEFHDVEGLNRTSEFRNLGSAPLVEVAGLLFGGIEGAASNDMWDYEYLRVWSNIIDLDN